MVKFRLLGEALGSSTGSGGGTEARGVFNDPLRTLGGSTGGGGGTSLGISLGEGDRIVACIRGLLSKLLRLKGSDSEVGEFSR